MNIYEFMKSLQDGIRAECKVHIRLWKFMDEIRGVEMDIDWPTDFHYRVVLPDSMLNSEGFLEHFCSYTIERASREYSKFEVGED